MKKVFRMIRAFSIRTKLTLMITGISLFVLVLLFVSFVLTQRSMLRDALLQELQVLAKDLSQNCSAALIFNDELAAEETLATLQGKPQIFFGTILDKNGKTFSIYSRPGSKSPADTIFLVKGHRFTADALEIAEPVTYNQEILGTLHLFADLTGIARILMHYVMLGLAGLVAASALAWFLAFRLQRLVSGPIEQLAAAMRSVSATRDYSQRVGMKRCDELGVLVENFNDMLTQIEARDADLQVHQERLRHLAHHDTLTGLANRLLFNDRLTSSLTRIKSQGRRLALMFLDLDRFKNINDSLGHKIGDEVLKTVAKRLTSVICDSDTLARLGGDEFVVIMEQFDDYADLSRMAERILEVLVPPVETGKQALYISCSIGISVYPEDGDGVESLMQCADVAMYQAKERGRNNYQFFTAGMTERAQEELRMESKLRQAIVNDELLMHYQPQVDLQSGRVIGMEALIRWQHPVMGLIPPAKFIPLAEETGLIIPLGKWILKAACKQARQWQQSGYPDWKMAVNISPKQFWQADLLETVADILEQTGLAPEFLELEITESAIMLDVEKAIDTMKRIRGMGISLAVDDFGTGYSSLSCLQRFPLSKLKIDRSFISSIVDGDNNGAIAEGIIALARTLHLEVIAEGIEELSQVEFLINKGCKQGQGFFFGHPMPPERLATYFLQNFTADYNKNKGPSTFDPCTAETFLRF